MAECSVWDTEVGGSNPLTQTRKKGIMLKKEAVRAILLLMGNQGGISEIEYKFTGIIHLYRYQSCYYIVQVQIAARDIPNAITGYFVLTKKLKRTCDHIWFPNVEDAKKEIRQMGSLRLVKQVNRKLAKIKIIGE